MLKGGGGRSESYPKQKEKAVTRAGWVIAFLAPCGAGRVNDKKVNEENSKVNNAKMHRSRCRMLRKENVSKGASLLDTRLFQFLKQK